MPTSTLRKLQAIVEEKPIVVLRFEEHEWESLQDSRLGINEFTAARSHGFLTDVKVPTLCLILGGDSKNEEIYLGWIKSKSPITTLESRIKIIHGSKILPETERDLINILQEKRHANNLETRLGVQSYVTSLSPKLSSYLLERLYSFDKNRGVMRILADNIMAPKYFSSTLALQTDAIQTALKTFGITSKDRADSLETVAGTETALTQISLLEDSVVEHDARTVPGYDLIQSDMTGRAVFQRGQETLEIYTANRRPLEHCFGVDLIYLNTTKNNIVMLQYKMLDPTGSGENKDWIYRPDVKLDEEISRMKKFAGMHKPGEHEYRLNPTVFYLKFVKRNGSIQSGGIITPLDHYEKIKASPLCKGPRDGLRISYNSLAGRYLRKDPFLDLIRSGYIGAYIEQTKQLKTLVDALLTNNRAIVVAIQESTDTN